MRVQAETQLSSVCQQIRLAGHIVFNHRVGFRYCVATRVIDEGVVRLRCAPNPLVPLATGSSVPQATGPLVPQATGLSATSFSALSLGLVLSMGPMVRASIHSWLASSEDLSSTRMHGGRRL